MISAKKAGRIVATLLLTQMILGYVVNFVLLQPALPVPGFLATAAEHAFEVSLAVPLGLAASAMMIGIAITLLPVLRPHSEGMALWLLALATAGLAVVAIEHVGALSMLSLSKAQAAGGQGFDAVAVVAASQRRWGHYLGLIMAGSAALVLYASLLRFALVPRAIAAFGVAATLLQLLAVTMPVFGQPIHFTLLAPIGIAHLALAVWLLAKGFAERAPSA